LFSTFFIDLIKLKIDLIKNIDRVDLKKNTKLRIQILLESILEILTLKVSRKSSITDLIKLSNA
jgi:hypothetical protein